jgi:hypothetical protein
MINFKEWLYFTEAYGDIAKNKFIAAGIDPNGFPDNPR